MASYAVEIWKVPEDMSTMETWLEGTADDSKFIAIMKFEDYKTGQNFIMYVQKTS